MKLNSLAFRLFATAAVWTIVVLPVAGFAIDYVRRREAELAHDRRLSQLLTIIVAFSTDHGGVEPRQPRNVGEPLFEITHSGWYWQITPLGNSPGRRMVSASLGTEHLAIPKDAAVKTDTSNVRWAEGSGPLGEPMRLAELVFNTGDDEAPRLYAYIVGGSLDFVDERIAEFRVPLVLALSLAGIGLIMATFFQVRFGLQPLGAIEKGLAAIRSGEEKRLEGHFPAEIEPLRTELNALIQVNQDTVDRARTHVGNLAHALKTPLAVILNEAREDATPHGAKITEQAEMMRLQVNHYLDRARVAAQAGAIGQRTDVEHVIAGLFRALERIYRERSLEFVAECPAGATFRGERQDLEEMLGNLLDNACKWAATKVRIGVTVDRATNLPDAPRLHIWVDDDGPGLTAEQRAQRIERGKRLDETKPGSGLGLSIVADFAQTYHGRFDLEASDLGGLSARLELPAA